MSEIPEEAVQAAAEALAAYYAGQDGDPSPTIASFTPEARAALEAAMPVLEKQLRDKLGGWLIHAGQNMLKDERRAPEPDSLGRGWAGALIGAGLLVENGYPKSSVADDA